MYNVCNMYISFASNSPEYLNLDLKAEKNHMKLLNNERKQELWQVWRAVCLYGYAIITHLAS